MLVRLLLGGKRRQERREGAEQFRMQIASVCKTERGFFNWPRAASTNSPVALEPMLVVHVAAYVLLPLHSSTDDGDAQKWSHKYFIGAKPQPHGRSLARLCSELEPAGERRAESKWESSARHHVCRTVHRFSPTKFASNYRIASFIRVWVKRIVCGRRQKESGRGREIERTHGHTQSQALFCPIKTKINNCVRFIFQAFRDRQTGTECVSPRNRFQCQLQLIFHRGWAGEYSKGKKNYICISDGFCCVCLLYQYWKTSPCTFTVNYLL